MQTNLRIALLTTIALVTPLHAQKAPPGQANASGLVTDATTGSPVRGALVEFPGLRRMALTDGNGRFTVTRLNSGRQKMVVNHMGYRTVVREVEVGESEVVNVPLDPDPIMLKGVEVQVDRIAARRKGVTASVAIYDRSRILGTAAFSAADFVKSNLGLFPCGRSGRESCLLYRGSAVQPVVYIDERRAFGLVELNSYPTQDIFLVESYNSGRMIRVYTTWFMQQLVRTNQPLQQIIIW